MAKKFKQPICEQGVTTLESATIGAPTSAQPSDTDHLNLLHNQAAYFGEGEWNAGDYHSTIAQIEELARKRRQDGW